MPSFATWQKKGSIMLPIQSRERSRSSSRRLGRLLVPFSMMFFASIHLSLGAKTAPKTVEAKAANPDTVALNTASIDTASKETANSDKLEKNDSRTEDLYPEMTGAPIDPSESFAAGSADDPDDFAVVAAAIKAKLAKDKNEPNEQAAMEQELARLKAEAAKQLAAEELRKQKEDRVIRKALRQQAAKNQVLEQQYLQEAQAEVEQFEGIEDFQLSWSGLEDGQDNESDYQAIFTDGAYGPEDDYSLYQ